MVDFTLIKRGLAQLIDLATWYFLALPAYYDLLNAGNPMAYDRLFNGFIEVITSIPLWVLYSFLLEWWSGGYSIGKFLVGLRVVSLSGGHFGLRQTALRWLGNWPDIYLTLGLGALVAVLVSKRQQRLGDLLAKTGVVQVRWWITALRG